MKKYVLIFMAFFASSFVFAEMNAAGRKYFEAGFSTDVSFSQTAIKVTDFFSKDVVIDFSEMNDKMGAGGLEIVSKVDVSFFWNCRMRDQKWGLGALSKLEVWGRFATGKGLFEFLGEGNSDVKFQTTLSTDAQLFITQEFPFYFKLGKFKIFGNPVLFVPLLYIPHADIDVKVNSSDEASLKADITGDLTLYANGISLDGMDDFSINSFGGSNWGFSIEGGVEYPLFEFLDVGGYASIPLIPGHLRMKQTQKIEEHYWMTSLLGSVHLNGEESEDSSKWEHESNTQKGESSSVDKLVFRPFRIGGTVEYRPFGNWFCVNGKFGVGSRNPYTNEFKAKTDLFVEFEARAKVASFNGYGPQASIGFGYLDQLWKIDFDTKLNARAVELNFGIATTSANFVSIWTLGGFEMKFGMTVGW